MKPERRLALEGCLNFRDLGGYPTRDGRRLRWRLLFRSDALHRLTGPDLAELGAIGLAEVIDLRSSAELRADGRGLLGEHPARFHHLPLFDGVMGDPAAEPIQDLGDLYFRMAEFARDPIARVVSTLARAEGPAVYHCAAGKDRTGLVSAVLLGLLDVAEEIIVADYAATRDHLDAIVERLLSSQSYQEVLSSLPRETLHAEPSSMQHLLERIGEGYGSMREYVRAIGVSDQDVARLESRLLESV